MDQLLIIGYIFGSFIMLVILFVLIIYLLDLFDRLINK